MATGLVLAGNRGRSIAFGLAAGLAGFALVGHPRAEDDTAPPAKVEPPAATETFTHSSEPAQPAKAAPAVEPAPQTNVNALAAAPEVSRVDSTPPQGAADSGDDPKATPTDAGAAVDTAAKPNSRPAEPAEGETSANQNSQESKPKPQKQAEPKEAKDDGKPKELLVRPLSGDELIVRASNINAMYEIHFLGTHIGDFRIRSSITNREYSLQAHADISVFFGAFSWEGSTSSHGLMTANGPMPQAYNFRYATGDRHEAIELRFQQRMVQDIIINPPSRPGMRTVPITAAHLQNVLDPLSAVVLLSQARLKRQNADPCGKRLPIFDGKTRYDLVMSSKGTRSIAGHGRLRGPAYVCAVHFVPIAGHKQGRPGENDYATGNTGIEVWLVPVPEAGLLVPYYVHLPTPAGTASMVTAKFDIDTAAGRHALAE